MTKRVLSAVAFAAIVAVAQIAAVFLGGLTVGLMVYALPVLLAFVPAVLLACVAATPALLYSPLEGTWCAPAAPLRSTLGASLTGLVFGHIVGILIHGGHMASSSWYSPLGAIIGSALFVAFVNARGPAREKPTLDLRLDRQ